MNIAPQFLTNPSCVVRTVALLAGFFAVGGMIVFLKPLLGRGQASAHLSDRYLTFAILAPVLLIPVYLAGGVLTAGITCLSILCQLELLRVAQLPAKPRMIPVALLAIATQVSAALPDLRLSVLSLQMPLFYVMPLVSFVVACLLANLIHRSPSRWDDAAAISFGTAIVGFCFAHIILLGSLNGGFGFFVFLIMCVVLNDIFAFTAGYFFGRSKMAPSLSPRKTWEGFIGGTIGTIVAACIFSYAAGDLPVFAVVLAALLISIFAPAGDLLLSLFKRNYGAKDFGTLLPGTGGALDRLDSLVLAAPAFYYLVVYCS